MSRGPWMWALVGLLGACRGETGGNEVEGGTCSTDCETASTSSTSAGSTSSGAGSSTSSSSSTTTGDTSSSTTDTTSSGEPTTGSSTGESEPSSARHTPRPLGTTDADQGYWEYLPPGYEETLTDPPPLLVFLHGVGANGDGDTELDKVLETGIPRMIQEDAWPADRPFVVVSPQYSGAQCPPASTVQSFLDFAISAYDIDPSRVYLTALSCGAYGGWNYLGQIVNTQIAATVLIAGNGIGPFNNVGCDLARVPIWAFHGDADETVPVAGTTVPIEGLLMCDPVPDVQMTIYPGVGHDSWTRTYDGSAGHDVFEWLLQYP